MKPEPEIHNSPRQVALPLLLAIAVVAGVLIGLYLGNYQAPDKSIQSSSDKYGQILGLINRDYVDTVNTEELVEYSIKQMLERLDPHTVYIPRRDLELAQSSLEQNFEGVGIEFTIVKDTLFVLNTISGGPSEKVGIQSGDKIVQVNGENIVGETVKTRDVFKLLRGPKGSVVDVAIRRRGFPELLDFKISRDNIPTRAISAKYMVNDSIGYIKLDRFAKGSYSEFYEALESQVTEGVGYLIFDLRDNGGGYLDEATNIIDEFLEPGKLIVYTKGQQVKHNKEYLAQREGLFEEGKVVVLINENSASASEIVAGALQDNDRALIVGRRSFGKGLVQKPNELIDGSELRLTISRYYTPSGRCIQKPYSASDKEYANDYNNRLESGELFSVDSIQVNDSLRYRTTNGRLVYGGGGILPDDFIPKDTSEYSVYLGNLYASNALREAAIYYANDNKQTLLKLGFDHFKKNFEVSTDVLDMVNQQAVERGVYFSRIDFERSENVIKRDFVSLVARNIWGTNAYYEMLNLKDPFIEHSMTLFPSAATILGGSK